MYVLVKSNWNQKSKLEMSLINSEYSKCSCDKCKPNFITLRNYLLVNIVL